MEPRSPEPTSEVPDTINSAGTPSAEGISHAPKPWTSLHLQA